MKRIFIIPLLLSFCIGASAQNSDYNSSPSKKTKREIKGYAFGSFGWHRVFYTPSTIHFVNKKSSDYDFRLIKAKGIDDNDIDVGKGFDAPQWSLRFGFIQNKKNGWGFEWSYDHAKYIVKQGQKVRLKGKIYSVDYDEDIILSPAFLEFEHTDGANYYMLSLIRRNELYNSPKNHSLDVLFKAGAGIVIPRTDSKINGHEYNEHYHISGWVAGMESSLRYEVFRHVFAELSLKGAYANYSDILLWGEGRASQKWWSLQTLFTVAAQVPVKKGKK